MTNQEGIMPNAQPPPPPPLIRGYYGSPFEYRNKQRNKTEKLWGFSPLVAEIHGIKGLKYKQDAAGRVMDKVLEKSGFTKESLLNELRCLVPKARDVYADDALGGLDDNKIIIRLSADACIWLLVVFSILGAKPDFPDQHPIFGKGCVEGNKEMWLRSIFFVGNQIPSFWLDKLVKSLKYLDELREQTTTWGKPSELLERTLFEFLNMQQGTKPVDVVYYLRSIFLGPKAPKRDKNSMWMVGSKSPHDVLKQQSSASALYKQGYTFKPLPQLFGYRRITCEHRMGMVNVYLPPIVVNDDVSLELAMKSAEKWEYAHSYLNTEYHPECTCFFNLLYNLIRTKEDVKVLSSLGVIGGGKSQSLPDILNHFYKMPNYYLPRCQKMEIQNNRPLLLPCWKFQSWMLHNISFGNFLLLFILTFLQTGYTIASYYKQCQK